MLGAYPLPRESDHRPFVLGMVARAGRELAIAQGPQLARQRLLGDRDAKLLPDPLDQVDQAPAHDTVNRRDWTIIKPCHESRSVCVAQLRGSKYLARTAVGLRSGV